MAVDNPNTSTVNGAPFTETTLESADEVHPEAHQYGTDQEKRSTTPLVDIDYSGD